MAKKITKQELHTNVQRSLNKADAARVRAEILSPKDRGRETLIKFDHSKPSSTNQHREQLSEFGPTRLLHGSDALDFPRSKLPPGVRAQAEKLQSMVIKHSTRADSTRVPHPPYEAMRDKAVGRFASFVAKHAPEGTGRHAIQTSPKGAQYYINASGEKIYVKK